MWDRVKKLAGMSKNKGEDLSIKVGDKVISDAQQLAEYMNDYFKEKVRNLQKKLTVDRDACIDYAKEYMTDLGHVTPPKFKFKTVGTGVVSKVQGLLNELLSEPLTTYVRMDFRSDRLILYRR